MHKAICFTNSFFSSKLIFTKLTFSLINCCEHFSQNHHYYCWWHSTHQRLQLERKFMTFFLSQTMLEKGKIFENESRCFNFFLKHNTKHIALSIYFCLFSFFFLKKIRLVQYKPDKITIIIFLTFVFFKSSHRISSPPLLAMHRVIMILKVGMEAHDSK